MKILEWKNLSIEERKAALARPAQKNDVALADKVAAILDAVKQRGDDALRDFSKQFDKVDLADLRIAPETINAALNTIPPTLRAAIEQAKANIEKFHALEKPHSVKIDTMPGVTCELQWRAIETVGFYIPGGSAPLFSSILMQAIPAHIAGCKRMILCTPPSKDGTIHPAILATAALCGLTEIYAVGGAQAIAAMAYGTQTIRKADKIFGPGNSYVTMAKQLVSQDPQGAAIDMPAGPSEVMVLADAQSNPAWVAADMLAQAEHGTDSQAICVTTDAAIGQKVAQEITQQLAALPRRAIAAQAITESRIIICANTDEALNIANQYACEHLIIHNADADQLVTRVQNAGSVFVGPCTPESAGDYASGTNHVLPTYGYARAYNGINVLSYMKSMTVQTITPQGLDKLGPTIIAMAEAEGLQAHANAVKIRTGQK